MINIPKVDVGDTIHDNSKLEVNIILYTLQILQRPGSTKKNFIILFLIESAIANGGAGLSPGPPSALTKFSKNISCYFQTLTPPAPSATPRPSTQSDCLVGDPGAPPSCYSFCYSCYEVRGTPKSSYQKLPRSTWSLSPRLRFNCPTN